MTVYEKIEQLCRKEGFAISSLSERVPGLKISRASITGWKRGSAPRPDKIKALADYFAVPVEYFSTDVDINVSTVQDNHGIIGNTHVPVTINSSGDAGLGDIERELVAICGKMDMKQKNALLSKAYEILEWKV